MMIHIIGLLVDGMLVFAGLILVFLAVASVLEFFSGYPYDE